MCLDAPQCAVESSVDRCHLTPSPDLQHTAEEVSTKANAPSTSKAPLNNPPEVSSGDDTARSVAVITTHTDDEPSTVVPAAGIKTGSEQDVYDMWALRLLKLERKVIIHDIIARRRYKIEALKVKIDTITARQRYRAEALREKAVRENYAKCLSEVMIVADVVKAHDKTLGEHTKAIDRMLTLLVGLNKKFQKLKRRKRM